MNIQEGEKFLIRGKEKAPLETEFIDEIVILGLTKPENERRLCTNCFNGCECILEYDWRRRETIEKALKNVVTYGKSLETISYDEFCELGLVGNKDSVLKREKVSNKFRLGKCNAKTLFKRLNMFGIKKEQLWITQV